MAGGRSRWDPMTVGLGAVSGALAGLAGAALAGGTGPNPVVGALSGLVVGLLGGLAASRVRPSATPSPTGHGGAVTAGDLLAAAGPGPARVPAGGAPAPSEAAAAGPLSSNLGPLVTAIGNRYRVLADRQLRALDGAAGVAGGASTGSTEGRADGHQATRLSRRMRRLAKTLEVLADDPGSPEPAPPTPMTDVLRAAIADNDEPSRIDYSSLHPATVDGEAVGDLVHLLAELIDNAVASSRGNGTKVVVVGRRAGDGYLLSVVDEGVGMPPADREAANGRLSSPPPLAQQSPTAFGLPTVGRLAGRHGIAVQLLEAATDGLIAKVRIPARLLDGHGASRPARSGAERGGDRGAARPDPGAGPGEGARRATVDVIDLTDEEGAPAAGGAPGDEPRSGPGDLDTFAPAPEGATAAAARRADAARRVVRGGSGGGGGGRRPGERARPNGPARAPDDAPGEPR